jgi:hypothetical protein
MRIKNRLKTKKRILGFLLTPLCLVNLFGIGFATFSFPKTAGIDGVNGGVGEIISSLDFISLDRIETSITCPTGFVFNEDTIGIIDERVLDSMDIITLVSRLKKHPIVLTYIHKTTIIIKTTF